LPTLTFTKVSTDDILRNASSQSPLSDATTDHTSQAAEEGASSVSIQISEYKRLIQASYNSQVNNYKSDNQNDVANKRGTLRYFYAP
jgi:hypothetical protein